MRMSFVLAACLIASPVPALAETVSGRASVIDGDTLEIGERRIRLFGIDAPETQQTCNRRSETWACGEESASQLRALVGSGQVTCSGDEIDRFGRLVAVCSVGYVELNKTMVAQGWATAFRRYSTAYAADEIRAGSARRGLWASDFVRPEAYRVARTGEAPPQVGDERRQTARQASAPCAIKGNRSRRGEWIYHLPGIPHYEQTRAEETFCSEAEAQAAGYRRSRAR